jgi:hypothetical protein
MKASLFIFALVGAVLNVAFGFAPMRTLSRAPVRSSTIVMDGKTRDLRDRIKSVKNTRRITEAMRLVAAARVRRAQEAVLKTRPLMAKLHTVSVFSYANEPGCCICRCTFFADPLPLRLTDLQGLCGCMR